ncbi:MAG: class I SAM-dependent methyltransferase [Alphaproteobacteria bacterium]|nr:class I SAM-dependent methyltransferase [Alphaproteobacteria bacterium]
MTRDTSFGQDRPPTIVDRFGIWLSARCLEAALRPVDSTRLLDIGAGFHAATARRFVGRAASVAVIDLSLSDAVKADPTIETIEGRLPETLDAVADGSIDRVIFNNVLEHLWERQRALDAVYRVLAPGGIAFINVPSWCGKIALEFSAFKLGLSPAEEMDDHKTYFDPRDLWPLLVLAGFKPSAITCRRHKFGLNTFAVCRKT